MPAEKTFREEFGRNASAVKAEQLYGAFSTSDLAHVKYLLGITGKGGFTHQIAYDLVRKFPTVADVIIARSKPKNTVKAKK